MTNRLSEHFTLGEMTKSQTATRLGIDNSPSEEHKASMKALCDNVLEPVRKRFGRPVIISSGYRSPSLCEAIGSKTTSQHAKGEAADFEVIGVSNYEVAKWVQDNLSFDQIILEFHNPEDPQSGWVHCSYKNRADNRNASLSYDGKSYTLGLGNG